MDKFEEWKLSFDSAKVIVRSNEDEPFKVGELVGYHKVKDEFPLVLIDEKQYICMGVVIPWSREMEFFLNSLPPKKQWEILSNISMAIQINR